MKQLLFKFLTVLFYYLGDTFWQITLAADNFTVTRALITPLSWSFYQKCMTISIKFDDKLINHFWKHIKHNE